MNPKYRLLRLEAIDFKRISAIALDVDGQTAIKLTGDNGQGKTSVLDAIMWVLTNKNVEQPIRLGTEETTGALTIRDSENNRTYTVKRRAKGENSYLEIKADDDAKMPSPQKFLDALIGNLAFDPEAFSRLNEKGQAEALRIAVGLDTSDLDASYVTTFAQRTEANRLRDQTETVYKACPIVAEVATELKDVAKLIAERDSLLADCNANQKQETSVKAIGESISLMELEVIKLQERLRIAEQDLAEAKTNQASEQANLDCMISKTAGHRERIQAINTEVEGAAEFNKSIEDRKRLFTERKAKEDAYRVALTRANELDEKLKKIKAEKEARIKECKFPIDGLSIEGDTVMISGVPFRDLNTAERIKLSTMIAMAQNPSLRVIFVREGALMNKQNLKVLTDIAEENDMQVWIEKFSEEPEEDSIHLQEGHVTHVDGKPAGPQQLELIG